MLLGGIVTDDHVVAMRWWGGEVVVACKRFTRRTGGLWRDKWLWFMDRPAQGAQRAEGGSPRRESQKSPCWCDHNRDSTRVTHARMPLPRLSRDPF